MSGSKRFYVGACLLLAVFLLPGFAGATDETDFQVMTTQDLIELCTTPPDDPLYPHAINFCHGYLVGAFHYHEAAAAGPDGQRLVCPPETRPSRNADNQGVYSVGQGSSAFLGRIACGDRVPVSDGKMALQMIN